MEWGSRPGGGGTSAGTRTRARPREGGRARQGAGSLGASRRVRVCVVRTAALALILLATVLPVRADEFATLLPALAGDSFAEKEQGVIALGKLGDQRAVAVLMALKDGRLIKAPDGRLLVSDATKLTDPITAPGVSGVAADADERIRVNNRLRGVIEGALGELTLFSPDPAPRRPAEPDAPQ